MDNPLHNIYAVILAAGSSSRLSRPKQLLPWHGSTLLGHVIGCTTACFQKDRVIVVLGANADKILPSISTFSGQIAVNDNWQKGMSSSIAAGMAAVPTTASAVLLLLCDQPMITSTQVNLLLETWQQNSGFIIASQYSNTTGVPAIFPSYFFGELAKLSGQQGAKQLFQKFPGQLITIPMPEAILDIDNQADYHHLLQA